MKVLVSVLLLMTSLLGVAPARAVLVYLNPSTTNISAGSTFNVSVEISGLNSFAAPALGAYDVGIAFDPAVVHFVSAAFGTGLDPFGSGDIQSITAGLASVDLYEISLDSDSDLISTQPGQFSLATLTFLAFDLGVSPLDILVNALADGAGNPLASDTAGASVNVDQGSTAIPEPGTAALSLMALGAAICASRRSRPR